jgi:hypothetical protein
MALQKFNSIAGFSVGEQEYLLDVIDSQANITANNLTVGNLTLLGNVGNVKITGGSANYVLKTDGTGNLSWQDQSAGGVNTYVQFNDDGLPNGVSDFTFNKTTKVLSINGNISAGNAIIGGGTGGIISGANLVSANYITAIANLTSGNARLGNLATANYITINANLTSGNANLGNLATANYITIDANITSGNANLGNLATANYVTVGVNLTSGNANITSNLSTGNANLGNLVTANYVTVNANLTSGNANLGNIAIANYFRGTLDSTSNDQSNITKVGTLEGLNVYGNTNITGNLHITGDISYVNSTITFVMDPIVEQGGLANNSGSLTSDDTKDRGTLLHYYNDTINQPVDAFMGWKNANDEFILASNVQHVENIITVRQYGNLRLDTVYGDLIGNADLTNLTVQGNATANNFIGRLANGSSNVHIPVADGNINLSSAGNANVLIITGTGINVAGTLNTGAGNANVGNIGVSGVIVPSTGNTTNGIIWPANPGGGTSDVASIQYYAVSGEQTRLELKVTNDIIGDVRRDDIYFTANGYTVVNNSTEATSSTVAPFLVTGGAGIAKKLYVGGNLTSANAVLGNLATANYVNVNNNLQVSGSAVVDGNLTVKGTFTYVESTTTYVTDPIVEQGGNASAGALTSNDGKDRGLLLHYYNTKAVDAFMGWDNSNAEFSFGGNVTVTDNVVTFNELGNIRSGNANLGNLVTANYINVSSNIEAGGIKTDNYYYANGVALDMQQPAGSDSQLQFNNSNDFGASANLTFSTTTNILTVIGNIKSDNANLGNLVTANYVTVNANLTSGNANLGNLATANYVTVNANLTSGNANLGNLATANYVTINANLISGNASLGNLATANFVNVSSNLTSGNANLGNLATANYFHGVFDATSNTQSNITTVGTLTNLAVAGNAVVDGNLTVKGTFTYVESTITYVTDPIVEQGGNTTAGALTSNDGKDRGLLLHYYDGKAIDAFMGWDNSAKEFAFGSNVSVTDNVVTFNELANIKVNSANVTGNLTLAGSLNVTGGIVGSVGNAIPLGSPTIAVDNPGNLVVPGSVTSWTTDTKVTDAIDDLNECLENIRNNTYVKSVSFTASPTAGGAGSTITLTITSVGNPNRYDIDWGDGSTTTDSTSTTPTHVYSSNSGSPYTVTVRAYNNGGTGTGSEASYTRTDYIIIYTSDPVMGFNLYRSSTGGVALSAGSNTLYVSEGETFYLENTTTNTTMATVAYTINWGDGTTDTISGDSASGGVSGSRKSHTYATGQNSGSSTKTITLTLTSHTTANPASIPRNTTKAIKIYNPSIASPDGLSSKTITFSGSVGTSPYLVSNFANNTGGATSYTAGVSVNRTVATSGTIETVALTSFAYNGDSGVLSAYVNGADNGNITLSAFDESSTYTSLVVSSESDYNLLTSAGASTTFSLSTYSPGLYKGFKAKIAKDASTISAGVNSLQLRHSVTGSTNTVEFVKDDVILVPTVDVSGATISAGTNGTFRYISGIPYYNTGSPTITLSGANIYDWIGQTYQNSSTPFQIEPATNDESTTGGVIASQTKNYSALDGTPTFLTSSIPKANTGKDSSNPYTIGNQTISITASSVSSVQTIKFRATNVNGTGTYATHTRKIQVFTASPAGFIEDNISVTSTSTLWSDNAKRIVISGATGATPAFVSATNYYTNSTWSGAQTIAGTDEAVVRWNQLKWFNTDLSTGYLPAGPNLNSGRTSGNQYFRGAFRRNAKSSITVTITGKISGLYIAAPGTAIDTASTLNGWLNASLAYNGSGVPGANSMVGGTNGCAIGTVVPTGSVISNQTYTLTLGTVSTSNSTGNQILFSIALASGDYITSWSFG